MALTKLQKAFAIAFARNGGKGAGAARKAGFSAHSANVTASRLLKREDIRAAIEREKVKAAEETSRTTTEGWDAERVLLESIKLFEEAKAEGKPVPQLADLIKIIAQHKEIAANEKKTNASMEDEELVELLMHARQRMPPGHRLAVAIEGAIEGGDKAKVASLFDEGRDNILDQMDDLPPAEISRTLWNRYHALLQLKFASHVEGQI